MATKTSQQYADEVLRYIKKNTTPKRIWPSQYPDFRKYLEEQFEHALAEGVLTGLRTARDVVDEAKKV